MRRDIRMRRAIKMRRMRKSNRKRETCKSVTVVFSGDLVFVKSTICELFSVKVFNLQKRFSN